MSAETLRRAAALIRERAEVARTFWSGDHPKAGQEVPWFNEADAYGFEEHDAPHIIGMSPAVALDLADWLDATADEPWCCDDCKYEPTNDNRTVKAALAVARSYLGE